MRQNDTADRYSSDRCRTGWIGNQLLSDPTSPNHVVLDKRGEVGSAWRDGRWDSFTLVMPNWSVRLPGFPYRGDNPDGFMKRAEVVSHLEQYASSFGAPVRFGVTVTAVDLAPGGSGYLVSTADGDTFAAANVVVATGSFQFPRPAKLADAFPPHIAQLHSSLYRNPDDLPPGAVLVVGSADTGCQIAEELFESGRQVYLCVGRSSRRPRRYRGKDVMFWGNSWRARPNRRSTTRPRREICGQPASHREKLAATPSVFTTSRGTVWYCWVG